MPDAPADNAQTSAPAPKRGRFGKFLGSLLFLACFLAACTLLALEASEPFGKPESCTMCHEMQPVFDRWSKSSHFANASGVKVDCIKCHLAPREDTCEHLWGKISKGSAHGWVHFFGQYDQAKSRKLVRDTMPNQRCTHCHNNLIAKSSTPAVEAVHTAALAETETRTHACITCHRYMHSEAPPTPEKDFYEKADNSYCYDCHMYLQRIKEPLIVRHAAVGVGCVACHGKSQPHVDDESCDTAPDIMYTREQINMSCGKSGCHSEKKLKKVISHKPWYAGAAPDKEVCTDCHGKHRIPDRDRKWDKKTRKLIWRDGREVDPNAEPDVEDGMSM